MISIKLPIKLLKEDTPKEKDRIEGIVYDAIAKWIVDYPNMARRKANIVWGTYFDIQGRGFPDGCEERMDLYKTIKNELWNKK